MTNAGMYGSILELLVTSAEYVLIGAENAFALAILVTAVTLLGRRWIAPRFRYLMWLLVAVRLAVPIAPASPFSLQQLWLPGNASLDSEARAASAHLAWQVSDNADPHPVGLYHGIENGQPYSTAATDFAAHAEEIVLLIWTSGGIVCALILSLQTLRFRRMLHRCVAAGAAQRCELLNECRQLLGVRRRVRLMEVTGLRSPAQMGLFRPTVLLPADLAESFSDTQLRHVFLHELTHVKRWDVAAGGLLALLRIVHWWNPVYWLVQSRLIAERELACDARVLRCLASGESRAYGGTLLEVVSRFTVAADQGLPLPANALGLVPFLGRKPSLQRRLRSLRSAGRGEPRGQRILAVVMTLVLLVVGCTDYRGTVAVAEDLEFQFPAETTWSFVPANTPVAEEVLITRVYGVEDLLHSLTGEFGYSLDDATALLEKPFKSSCGPQLVTQGTALAGNESPGSRPFFAWAPDGMIVIRASREQHESLGRVLSIWRRHGPQQISLEVRLMNAPENQPLPLGAGGRIISPGTDFVTQTSEVGSRDDSLVVNGSLHAHGRVISERRVPVYVQTLSQGLRDQIINAAQGRARSNIMMAPRVTLFNGQQATVSSVVERPFVTGLDDSSGSPEPQIKVLRDGFQLAVTAVSDANTGRIHLGCNLSLDKIVDVSETSVFRGEESETLTVQVPQVESQQYTAAGELADGESLLLSPLLVDDSGTRLYVVITARRVYGNAPGFTEE